MATQRFIDITVRSKDAEKDVKNLDTKMKGLGRTADGAVKTLTKLTKVAAAVAVAITAAATATAAMIKSSADARRETEQLARLVKVSADEFNALAFATKQYGVSAEQIADISKDIADRVGEFTAAGTGTFQDYVDVLNLTKEAAKEAAKEFQFMSGPEVIQKMVNEMEAANITGAQMTFVLESMGNDLSKLQPLFANNGEEIKRLTGGFDALNSELSITVQQADDLKLVSQNFDLMAGSAQASSLAISAALAPALNELFDSIINAAPTATQLILDLLGSITSAENIKNIKQLDRQIVSLQAAILDIKDTSILGLGDSFFGFDTSQSQGSIDAIERIRLRISELVAQREKLAALPPVTGVDTGTGGTGGVDADNKKLEAAVAFFEQDLRLTERHLRNIVDLENNIATEAQINEENRFLTKVERLQARAATELELLGTNEAAKVELRASFDDAQAAALTEHEALMAGIRISAEEDAAQKIISIKASVNQQAIGLARLLVGNSKVAAIALIAVEKGLGIAQTLVNSQVGATKALAVLGPIAGPPAAASILSFGKISAGLIAATGLAQAASIGGSSPSIGGGGGGGQQAPTATAQELPTQTRAIDIRIDPNGVFTAEAVEQILITALSTNDNVIVEINSAQNEARRTGAIS